MMRKKLDLPPDLYTRHGAQVLADIVRDFWLAKGFRGIVTQTFVVDGTRATYGVTSNIGPTGYPPRSVVLGV